MADYSESTVSGVSWQRCCQVVADNRHGQPPEIRFDEERITVVDDGRTLHEPLGSVVVPFAPAAEIRLFDPTNGQPTGQTITWGEAYAIVYSAYLTVALARDAALAELAAQEA